MLRSKAVLAFVLFAFVACATGGRVTLQGMSPASGSDLFSVASQKLIDMGYSIENGDRDAGFIVAEKQAGKKGFAENIQVIRVSFSGDGEGTSFSVQASTDYIAALSGERKADNPDDIVKEDARELRETLTSVKGGGSR